MTWFQTETKLNRRRSGQFSLRRLPSMEFLFETDLCHFHWRRHRQIKHNMEQTHQLLFVASMLMPAHHAVCCLGTFLKSKTGQHWKPGQDGQNSKRWLYIMGQRLYLLGLSVIALSDITSFANQVEREWFSRLLFNLRY